MSSFDGAVVVVTGAGSGLGRASALRFSEAGASVVAVDRAADAVAETVDLMHGPALAVTADVSREDEVDAYLAAATDAFGAIDVHHLNAGVISTLNPFPDVPTEEFDRVMSINARGTFFGMRGAFQAYDRQGTSGSIVLTSSIHALRGSTDLVAYQISKAAMTGMVSSGAMYGGPRGIRVNAVAPGVIPTPKDEQIRAEMHARSRAVPMRRPGTELEIADAVLFLASPAAGYITGQTVSADGGASIVNTVRPSGGAGLWSPVA